MKIKTSFRVFVAVAGDDLGDYPDSFRLTDRWLETARFAFFNDAFDFCMDRRHTDFQVKIGSRVFNFPFCGPLEEPSVISGRMMKAGHAVLCAGFEDHRCEA